MAKKTKVIAWDTCVIIDAIQQSGDKWEKIAPIIQEAESGNLSIVVSEISIIECSHLKESTKSSVEQHKLIDEWFESPFIVRRGFHQGITKLAVSLARDHHLSAADAIVLATAIKNNVSVLHTGAGTGRKSGKKLLPLSGQVGNPLLTISEPNPTQLALFT